MRVGYLCLMLLVQVLPCAGDSLEDGFRNPPMSARPSIYYLLLNGYVNRGYVDKELEAYKKAGVGGLCLFDMGARGPAGTVPPAGPAFLSPQSVGDLAHIIKTAGRLGMEVNLSVTSSWDLGGSWVKPEDGSMTLVNSETEITGPHEFDGTLPFPGDPKPLPSFYRNVAVLALPDPQRRPGWEFVYELPNGVPREVDHAAFYNAPGQYAARDFTVSVSQSGTESPSFREVAHGTLRSTESAQEFRFAKVTARYVRLVIQSSYDPNAQRAELAEFELYTPDGNNVMLSHSARRIADGPRLLRFSSEFGHLSEWSANGLNDGRKNGARGTWASAGPPPLAIGDSRKVINLTASVSREGRLHWKVPPGRWLVLRYICINTGEHLKVPSPRSDGLATDHLNTAATKRCLQYVVDQLRTAIPTFQGSALKNLYLASYEVQGQIWTPDFLRQFQTRRGYDLTPFLPVLRGGLVDNESVTGRVRYDFDKTLGEMLVDNYYRAAGDVAHQAGLLIESEAGGPGPPIHRVPVDALQAQGAVDVMRGEFWPYRPDAQSMWVVKETASAAHIYGHPLIHMESFTSTYHWQEGPAFLKAAADRAFTEGMNHVVWHTASHQPPESGTPGWVYGAGTHMSQKRAWWPMMQPFLEYLGRTSFLLQQGHFAADVLSYYGDQGYNFVMPKHVDPSLGYGYDYDVTNEEVLLHRLGVRNGKLVLPDGMHYEILVLPDREDIDLPALRKVEQLVREGATVSGPKPRRSVGYRDHERNDAEVQAIAGRLWGPESDTKAVQHAYGKGKIVWGRPLRDVLRERGVEPDFTFAGPRADAALDYIHRTSPDAEIYFIRNKQQRWEEVRAHFRVAGRQPEIWSPDTSEIRPCTVLSSGEVPLRLAPQGSTFIVFRKNPSAPAIISVKRDGRALEPSVVPGEFPPVDLQQGIAFSNGDYEWQSAAASKQARVAGLPSSQPIAGTWTLKFPDGWGAPPSLPLPKLTSWTESDNPNIRYFSGIAEYSTEFVLPQNWIGQNRRVFLDLGRLWAAAEVTVNDRPAGILWKVPYRADITASVHAGANSLRIRVANDWANRLIGDARNPKGKHYTHTNIVRTAPEGLPWEKVDPIPSGLFGPVVLRAGDVLWR